MILSDWLLIVPLSASIIVLILDKKKSKKYGGYEIPKGRKTIVNHFWTYNKHGKIVPGKGQRSQAIINGLYQFFLWAIAVSGIFILKILGW